MTVKELLDLKDPNAIIAYKRPNSKDTIYIVIEHVKRSGNKIYLQDASVHHYQGGEYAGADHFIDNPYIFTPAEVEQYLSITSKTKASQIWEDFAKIGCRPYNFRN